MRRQRERRRSEQRRRKRAITQPTTSAGSALIAGWMVAVVILLWFGLSAAGSAALANRSASYIVPITAGAGQYLAELSLGTPTSPFTAILDTGSDLLWRQCFPCQLCYPQAPLPAPPLTPADLELSPSCSGRRNGSRSDGGIFHPRLSSTYSEATCSDVACSRWPYCTSSRAGVDRRPCRYDIEYVAPSAYTRGVLSYDTLSLMAVGDAVRSRHHGSRVMRVFVPVHDFAFGCSHSSKAPHNFAGAGGIVGMGRNPLSLPSQLNLSRFSYCLPDTGSRAYLVLGAAASLGIGPVQTVSFIDAVDYAYLVALEAILINGRPLSIPTSSLGSSLAAFPDYNNSAAAGIFFDSGTTFTNLPSPAFMALHIAFSAAISFPLSSAQPENLTLCYDSMPAAVPSLSFYFHGGASMHLPLSNYFIHVDNVFCLAFVESPDDRSILGNVQQQNYHILYDLQAKKICFKRKQCRYSRW